MTEDDYLAHEALHMTHVCVCILNDHVTSHIYVAQDAELTRMAEAAEDAIAALYQAIANKRSDGEVSKTGECPIDTRV